MKKRNLFGRERSRQGITAAEHVQRAEPVRKNKKQRYEALFIHENAITARSGKTVYISKEHHDRIIKILQVIEKTKCLCSVISIMCWNIIFPLFRKI